MALEVNDGSLAEVLASNKITVLDIWAPWCGPCRMLGPIIEELSTENTDIAIGKLNIDENPETAVKYGIRGIPTILFFKDGEIVEKVVGVKSKAELNEKIASLKS